VETTVLLVLLLQLALLYSEYGQPAVVAVDDASVGIDGAADAVTVCEFSIPPIVAVAAVQHELDNCT
jgi:hypothetical protein